jgi:hypothetical protein
MQFFGPSESTARLTDRPYHLRSWGLPYGSHQVVLDSSIRTCSIGLLLPSVSKDGHGEQGMKAEEGSLP